MINVTLQKTLKTRRAFKTTGCVNQLPLMKTTKILQMWTTERKHLKCYRTEIEEKLGEKRVAKRKIASRRGDGSDSTIERTTKNKWDTLLNSTRHRQTREKVNGDV